jgi:Peptidase A4 family
VVGTWVQPSAICAAGESSWSSPWVGIDGNNSSTVEQVGTDTDCSRGNPFYYAWYEMYPKSLVQIPMTVTPGHTYTGEVTSTNASTYTMKLTDNTTGATFQTTQTSKKAKRTSVEWVMEGPSSGLLTNFSSVSFSQASATISGKTGTIASIGGADAITMVNSQGLTRALPSALGTFGNSFSVAWKHG